MTTLFRRGFLPAFAGLLLLLCGTPAPLAHAQTVRYGPVVSLSGGSSGTLTVSSSVADSQGNTFVAGSFTGTVAFGATTLTSQGGQDVVVAKLDATGAYLWAAQAGGTGFDGAAALALHSDGSLYVSGSYYGPAAFGLTALPAIGPGAYPNTDVFVGRLDGAGNWLWVRGAGSAAASDGPGGLTLDAAGNVYLGGGFGGVTAQFGPFTLTNSDPLTANVTDLFVTRLSATGTWQWVRSGGSSGYDWVKTLALDNAGHLYAYGNFEGNTLTLGSLSVGNIGSGSNDVYVARLDTAGTWQWARGAGGTFIDYDGHLALDGAGSAYIVGSFRSPVMRFGPLSLLNHNGTRQLADLFVAKLDATGTWAWATGADTGLTSASGIAVTAAGEATVAGSFVGSAARFGATTLPNTSAPNATNPTYYLPDAFLAQLSPGGAWVAAVGSSGAGSEAAQRVAYTTGGSLLAAGTFQGALATFGGTTLTGSVSEPVSFLTLPTGVAGPASITAMAPASGAPNQTVTLTGRGFTGATQVLFNTTPAASFAVLSDTRLTAVVPVGATAGPIRVQTSAGTGSSAAPFQPTAALSAQARAAQPLALYPNPATSWLQLPGLPTHTRVQLLDALGRVVRETVTTTAAPATVSVRGLKPGLYVLRATTAQGQHQAGRVRVE